MLFKVLSFFMPSLKAMFHHPFERLSSEQVKKLETIKLICPQGLKRACEIQDALNELPSVVARSSVLYGESASSVVLPARILPQSLNIELVVFGDPGLIGLSIISRLNSDERWKPEGNRVLLLKSELNPWIIRVTSIPNEGRLIQDTLRIDPLFNLVSCASDYLPKDVVKMALCLADLKKDLKKADVQFLIDRFPLDAYIYAESHLSKLSLECRINWAIALLKEDADVVTKVKELVPLNTEFKKAEIGIRDMFIKQCLGLNPSLACDYIDNIVELQRPYSLILTALTALEVTNLAFFKLKNLLQPGVAKLSDKELKPYLEKICQYYLQTQREGDLKTLIESSKKSLKPFLYAFVFKSEHVDQLDPTFLWNLWQDWRLIASKPIPIGEVRLIPLSIIQLILDETISLGKEGLVNSASILDQVFKNKTNFEPKKINKTVELAMSFMKRMTDYDRDYPSDLPLEHAYSNTLFNSFIPYLDQLSAPDLESWMVRHLHFSSYFSDSYSLSFDEIVQDAERNVFHAHDTSSPTLHPYIKFIESYLIRLDKPALDSLASKLFTVSPKVVSHLLYFFLVQIHLVEALTSGSSDGLSKPRGLDLLIKAMNQLALENQGVTFSEDIPKLELTVGEKEHFTRFNKEIQFFMALKLATHSAFIRSDSQPLIQLHQIVCELERREPFISKLPMTQSLWVQINALLIFKYFERYTEALLMDGYLRAGKTNVVGFGLLSFEKQCSINDMALQLSAYGKLETAVPPMHVFARNLPRILLNKEPHQGMADSLGSMEVWLPLIMMDALSCADEKKSIKVSGLWNLHAFVLEELKFFGFPSDNCLSWIEGIKSFDLYSQWDLESKRYLFDVLADKSSSLSFGTTCMKFLILDQLIHLDPISSQDVALLDCRDRVMGQANQHIERNLNRHGLPGPLFDFFYSKIIKRLSEAGTLSSEENQRCLENYYRGMLDINPQTTLQQIKEGLASALSISIDLVEEHPAPNIKIMLIAAKNIFK